MRGIILKKIPYGEADEILTVLFQNQGIRKVFIAGSRKSKKRYPGIADHFAHLEFTLKTPPYSLWRVIGLTIVATTDKGDLSDLRIYGFLVYLAEIICEFVPEGVDEEVLYTLWLDLGKRFSAQGFCIDLVLSTLLDVLKQTGYALSWDNCVACQNQLSRGEECGFDERHGGFLCSKCDFGHGIKFKRECVQAQGGDFVCKLLALMQNILQKKIKSAEFFLTTLEGLNGKQTRHS